ncbi:carbamoyltransferase [Burkholderia sp. AU38729]|uniref:carbamoyltransferase family protein n=1 Tax=Burkholderia sp. AU38729 TaxID=2879633 RepID=UPI001CF1B52F|nr:carbamoyltransferase [Burkholderia sp. AU38729]MCA8060800.1 carbamoyltransferase [Burkholderia sp. AU38729]
MTSYIVGLSAYYHDSAVALLADGEILGAAQEERFTRIKQDKNYPAHALDFCLRRANISIGDVEKIFYYENPKKKLRRIMSTYLHFGLPGYRSFVSELPSWLFEKVNVKKTLSRELMRQFGANAPLPPIEYIDHHVSHAAAAFFPSPFPRAAVLCIDGVGEWATTSAWIGDGNAINPVWDIEFPHSLGLLYSAITYFCGFKVDSGEYKLMGLAPYGEPRYAKTIRDHLIDVKPDGSFWLNMAYFDYAVGNCMISPKFEQLFGGPRRKPEALITKREFDLAASIQLVLEETLILLAKSVRMQSGQKALCLAGGVALNCVANGRLLKTRIFDDIWVQPAAGDSGGALGAALAGWHGEKKQPRKLAAGRDSMKSALLGSSYDDAEIETALTACGAVFRRVDEQAMYDEVADLLAQGNVVGWFQGAMEFGPRSLGARAILGDARNLTMQSVLNLKIKNRESFRPFAPAVLEEHASQWFQTDGPSPYMLFVVGVEESRRRALTQQEKALDGIELLKCIRSSIPAVTHVDYSARVQTVGKSGNVPFRRLLETFYQQTGCPVLVNTSFNVRGEPIVESPENAYLCFMRTQMDYLVIGRYILRKTDQAELIEEKDWREEFALD